MATTRTSIQLRPFHDLEIPNWIYFYRKINWLWWLQRLPMFLLAIPAAYGTAAFSSLDGKIPSVVALCIGLAFESTYIGTIALGDQMSSDDHTGKTIWFALNIAAPLASVFFNTLYFSGGKYIDITPEAVTHGLFLPVMNFFYGWLLHHISSLAYKDQIELQKSTKYHCEYCNLGKPNKQAVWSHYKYCPEKLAGNAKKYPLES